MAKGQLPYVLHTEGLAVLLPHGELLSYYPAHDDTKCCVPCTLHYRQAHGLGLETSDLALLINPPDEAELQLQALEARVAELQVVHKWEPRAARTALIEIDETKEYPHLVYGRVTLLVTAEYSEVFERQLFFGHAAWAQRQKRGPVPHMSYWLAYEHEQLRLTREQSLEALRCKGLPPGVTLPEPFKRDLSDEEVLALFDRQPA